MQLNLAVAAAFAALFALSTAAPDPRGGSCGDTQDVGRDISHASYIHFEHVADLGTVGT